MNSNYKLNSWPKYSEEEIELTTNILSSGKVNYWTGEHGKIFEDSFSRYIGTDYSIAVANGTLALELALHAIGINEGDEVIVTPRSFIASASCVINSGGIPIFADIDPLSGNINAETIGDKITSKTRAIICVHLGGWPCEMTEIMELADKNNIYVIEDCAQAHGATYKNNKVGSIGHIGAWSFCQDKIMSTGGEGGMITTNDKELWMKMWSFKDHGKDYKLVHKKSEEPGFKWLHNSFGSNYRMTEIQSAIGFYQLNKLDNWTSVRKSNAEFLSTVLEDFKNTVYVPKCPSHMENAFYRFYSYIDHDGIKPNWSRDRIVDEINKQGVPCFQGSCPEIYLEHAFKGKTFIPKERLVNAKKLGETSIAFLAHPSLTKDDLEFMGEKIRFVISSASR